MNKQGKGNCTTYIDTIVKDYDGDKVERKDQTFAISQLTLAIEDRNHLKIYIKKITCD